MQLTKGHNLLPSRWAPVVYLPVLALTALWLGGRLPYHNDLLIYVYPERAYNAQSLGAGLIPLWNPYLSCGIPHLANWQSAFFYPPYWLLNLLGLPQGLVWLALLHDAWAFAGFFYWARSRKCGVGVSLLGALSFAGSAHFIRCWINLPFIATLSWVPWAFLCVEQALQRPRLRENLLAVGVLSLQLLAGYPTFVLYTWAVLGVWAAFRRPFLPALVRTAGIMGAALLLTCLQWLPFLEFLTYAYQGHWNVFPYYTHPWEYLTLFDPTLAGVPGAATYKSDPSNSLFGNLYFGFLPCVLWILSLFAGRKGGSFWKWTGGVLMAWMAGPSLSVSNLISEDLLNFLDPSKALGLFVFAACAAACLFLADLFRSGRLPGRHGFGIKLLAALWLLDLLVLPYRLTYRIPDPYLDPSVQRQVETIRRETGGERLLALGTPAQMTLQGGEIDEGLQARMSRIFVDGFLPNTTMVWGLRTVTGYFSLQTDNLVDIMRYINRGFPYSGDLLEVAGVRAFLFPQPLPVSRDKLVAKEGGDFLSKDPQASDDLRWVGGSEIRPDRPSVLDILAEPGSGWREKAYLDEKPGGTLTRLAPVDRPSPDNFAHGNTDHSFQRVKAGQAFWRQNGFAKPGYVVFNESYAPGWHAWVDGSPQPILRAYGLFMAVAVESGDHQVEFRYEPAIFRLGLFISLVTLVAAGLGLWKAFQEPVHGLGPPGRRK